MAQNQIYTAITRSLSRITLDSGTKVSQSIYKQRQFHTTSSHKALDEFFDAPDNYGEQTVKSGRAWRIEELRLKSNSDLHKLWYVLYKERNMLHTMQEAAKSETELFPSPERIDKVEISMANLENVVRERNEAYWKLEVSGCATGERPSVYRRDVLGRYGQRLCSQHITPYNRNKIFRDRQGPSSFADDSFSRRYTEELRRRYNQSRSRKARHIRNIFRRFPDADVDYIQEIHPEFPAGYVQHLKDNLDLYDDPPEKGAETTIRRAVPESDPRQSKRLIE